MAAENEEPLSDAEKVTTLTLIVNWSALNSVGMSHEYFQVRVAADFIYSMLLLASSMRFLTFLFLPQHLLNPPFM